MMELARRVSLALGPTVGANGSLLAMNTVIGQTVFHAHVHVIPRRKRDGVIPFGILNPIRRYRSAAERDRIQAALSAALGSEQHGAVAPPSPS